MTQPNRETRAGVPWIGSLIIVVAIACQLSVTPSAVGQRLDDLDALTDSELVDLYIESHQESLRDSIVDKTNLAAPGRSLVQIGYSYTTQSADSGLRYSTHTVPEFLIRYRIAQRIELRGAWGGATFDRLEDEPSGITDTDSTLLNPSLGTRVRFWRQRTLLPQMSLTASTPVDLDGNAGFLSRLNPQLSLGYSWLVGRSLLVAGSTGAVWTRGFNNAGNEERFLDLQQSLSLDWLASERWSAYLQWTALLPEGARVADVGHSLGPGVSIPVGERTQVDFATSFGLDDGSPDFGTQLFLTRRF